jgi:hypothetical protein
VHTHAACNAVVNLFNTLVVCVVSVPAAHRTPSHDIGGWYIEWEGYKRAVAPGFMDPAVWVLACAFSTLEFERQLGRYSLQAIKQQTSLVSALREKWPSLLPTRKPPALSSSSSSSSLDSSRGGERSGSSGGNRPVLPAEGSGSAQGAAALQEHASGSACTPQQQVSAANYGQQAASGQRRRPSAHLQAVEPVAEVQQVAGEECDGRCQCPHSLLKPAPSGLHSSTSSMAAMLASSVQPAPAMSGGAGGAQDLVGDLVAGTRGTASPEQLSYSPAMTDLQDWMQGVCWPTLRHLMGFW